MTTLTVDDVMALGPVIPVLVVHDPVYARPIAQALVAGGILALEVTLRTPCALEVIAEMAQVPGAVVGAGTVVSADQVDAVRKAGAHFLVSPGLTERLALAAADAGLPLLPGVSDATDIMRGLDLGLTRFKFFPAEASGGIGALKALSAPFYQCRFCPTGGISADTAANWLALPSVACVGGSWLVPPGEPDVAIIKNLASRAAQLNR